MTKKQFPEGFFTKDRPIAKPKYVNAEDMLNNYEADCEVYENNGDSLDAELWMVYYLKNHSSADVQPVMHAHWTIKELHYPKHLVRLHTCSSCKGQSHRNYKFCPNCGAKMDGDEHDTD